VCFRGMFVDNDGDMGTSVLRQKVFVVYLQKVSWLLGLVLCCPGSL
jgi:hypothetical protein